MQKTILLTAKIQIISNSRNTKIPATMRTSTHCSRDLDDTGVGTEAVVVALLSLTCRLVIGIFNTPVLFASVSIISTVFSSMLAFFLTNTRKSTPTLLSQKRRTCTDRNPSRFVNALLISLLIVEARAWYSGVYVFRYRKFQGICNTMVPSNCFGSSGGGPV